MFGFRDKSIITQGRKAIATVTDVKKCWWFKVNTKPVRMGSMDGAAFPHIIHFAYTVHGVQYSGRRFLNHTIPVPFPGKQIEIFYDENKPSRCTVKL